MELERFEELVDRDIHGELTPRETAELAAACLANAALRRAREQDRRLAALMSRQGPNRAPAGLSAMIMEQIAAEAAGAQSSAAFSDPAAQPVAAQPVATQPASVPPRQDLNPHPPVEERSASLRLDWEQAARRRRAPGVFALFTSSLFRWGFALTVLGVIIYQASIVFRQPLEADRAKAVSAKEMVASVPYEEPPPAADAAVMESEAFRGGKSDRMIASANEAEAKSASPAADPPADSARLDEREELRKEIQVADAAPPAVASTGAAKTESAAKRTETKPEGAKNPEEKSKEKAREKAEKPSATAAVEAPGFALSAPSPMAAKDAPAAEVAPAAAVASAPAATKIENRAPSAEAVAASTEPTNKPADKAADMAAEKVLASADAGAQRAADAAVQAEASAPDAAKLAEARARDEAAANESRAAADEVARARADLERRLADAEAERDKLKAKLDDRKVASAEPASADAARDELGDRIESLRKRLSEAAHTGAAEPGAVQAAASKAADAPMMNAVAPDAPKPSVAAAAGAPSLEALDSGAVRPAPAAPQPSPAPEARRREPITLKKARPEEPAQPATESRQTETARIPVAPAVDSRALDAAAEAPAPQAPPPGVVVSSVDDLRKQLAAQSAGQATGGVEPKREPIRIAPAAPPTAAPAESAAAAPPAVGESRGSDVDRLRESLARMEPKPRAAAVPQASEGARPATAASLPSPPPVDPKTLEKARRELARREREASGAGAPLQVAQGATPMVQAPLEAGRKAREPVQIRAKGSDGPPPSPRDPADKQMTPVSGQSRAPRAEAQAAAPPESRAETAKVRLKDVEAAIVANGGSVLRRGREADKSGVYRFKVKVSRERLEDMGRALEKIGVKSGKGPSRYDVTDQNTTTAEVTVQVIAE